MRRLQRSLPGLIAGVSVLATLVVGCGRVDQQSITIRKGGGGSGLSAAADATASESYTFEVEATVAMEGGAEQSTSLEGAVDGDRSTMTMQLPVPGADVSMELIIDDGRQYLRYLGMPAGSPLPEGWIELEGAGSTEAILSTTSVDSFLERFSAEGTDVDDKGIVERDGDEYHRYETTLDLSASYEIDTTNRVMKRMMEAAAETNSKVDATIDVDSDNRVAQIVYENQTLAGTSTSTVTLDNYGEPVDIDVPDDAERFTLDEFAELVYPGGVTDDVEDVDPDDLISREEFIDLLGDQPELTDELAGCFYDEIMATNPGVLSADELSGSDLGPDAMQAFTAAGMVCGMTGG